MSQLQQAPTTHVHDVGLYLTIGFNCTAHVHDVGRYLTVGFHCTADVHDLGLSKWMLS